MTEPIAIRLADQRATVSVRGVVASLPRDNPAVRSLYIHTPFCAHKCHYCDFYSLVDQRDRQDAFVTRLERELAALAPLARDTPLSTIFVGGGTPSLLRVDLWKRLLATLARHFDLRDIHNDAGEFTVECNPESVTPELVALLRQGGVNRVSMGAQSFNPVHLKALERWHDPDNVEKALGLARDAGIRRQSIDLIFAIPGQTLRDWEHDIARALALNTEHLSCYNLTYEPNTAMTARKNRGEFAPTDEDLEVEMLETALRRLRGAGLDRYEVSNFARPGAECRHNLAYWRQDQWLAAGPSASAHVGGHRWKNSPRLDDYLAFDDQGFASAVDHEPPDARRAFNEWLMTGLRLREGLDRSAVLRRAGSISPERERSLRDAMAARVAQGHAMVRDGRYTLTDAGMLLADALAEDMME